MTKNKPARMYIVDTSRPASPDATLTAQFNPTELEETLAVNWNKLAVLGLSHMPLQFQQTDNHGFSFEFAYHAIDDEGNKLASIAQARRFLLALCYPSRGAKSVTGGAPARALFVWPKLASITCVVRKLAFKHTMFNTEGDPVVFSAKATLEEIRDGRLYAEDVRKSGTIRTTGA